MTMFFCHQMIKIVIKCHCHQDIASGICCWGISRSMMMEKGELLMFNASILQFLTTARYISNKKLSQMLFRLSNGSYVLYFIVCKIAPKEKKKEKYEFFIFHNLNK